MVFCFCFQELIMCSIIVLFLFVSFIVTAVYAWLHPAIGAVCVSSAFACVFHLLSASNNSHVPQIQFGSVNQSCAQKLTRELANLVYHTYAPQTTLLRERATCRLSVMVYHCLHATAPQCRSELCTLVAGVASQRHL